MIRTLGNVYTVMITATIDIFLLIVNGNEQQHGNQSLVGFSRQMPISYRSKFCICFASQSQSNNDKKQLEFLLPSVGISNALKDAFCLEFPSTSACLAEVGGTEPKDLRSRHYFAAGLSIL